MNKEAKNVDAEKRNVPPFIEILLAYDIEWTKKFVSFSLNFIPIRSLRTHCKFLEVSIVEIEPRKFN